MCGCGKMTPLSLVSWRILCLKVLLVFSSTSARPHCCGPRDGAVPDSAQHYLMTFGYLPQSDFEIGNLRTEEELINAIKEMQTFAGIPATGKIDEKTLKLMHTPRCGLPDVDKSFGGDRTRPKRYLLQGQRWPRTALTWT
ncbi:unnamed protein product [Notodromas monacha]|uniref:Peptidoglycan binding-like domain-containing protein n=1 Tax=Notodromas monacha TaxID=399045 RepID=A0A7R9BYL3_9CRUS|nr:unnamed protein product [Notodromas monacha]CAG0923766.1 unnamed protein product [Notodromas monacha]